MNLKIIDSLLLILWKLTEFIFLLILLLVFFIIRIVRLVFGVIISLSSGKSVSKRKKGGYDWQSLLDFFRHKTSWFSEKMKESKVFRRCTFLVLLVLTILYFYPPSHWGPWQFYETGVASYYSKGFWFKKTASGERFIPLFFTAAHKKLPLGTTVKVKNLTNGKVVYVKINDRGPFVKGRIIDLSSAAAKRLGVYEPGTANVVIYTRKKY